MCIEDSISFRQGMLFRVERRIWKILRIVLISDINHIVIFIENALIWANFSTFQDCERTVLVYSA